MAKSEFSETQFVFGYLNEYLESFRSKYPGRREPFWFPTTVEEPKFGSDIIMKGLKSINFIQFKRSELMNSRRGKQEIKSGLDRIFLPYYRFKVYNSGNIPQFDRLRDIAGLSNNFKVYYCAPRFISNQNFQDYFWRREIVRNSVLIDCKQFNQPGFKKPYFDINDGEKHFMVYNYSNTGYLCSEKKGFKTTENPLDERDKNVDFEYSIIDQLFKYLHETEPELGKYNIGRYNEGFQNKLKFCIYHLQSKYGIQTFLKYNNNRNE